MSDLLPLPVALPLILAAVGLPFRRRERVQRTLVLTGVVGVLAYAVALVAATDDGTTLAMAVGAFPRPYAISLAADLFSALMVAVAALMTLVCYWFAIARREDREPSYGSLILVLLAGICGAFLTTDLFNLFVFFEVMLMASYVLLTMGGTVPQVRGGLAYVVTNLMGSTVFVIGVALVYGAEGNVNMATFARAGALDGPVMAGGSLLLVAFALKSSLVPLHGWLPVAYPAATPAVAALFSGLLTKVGVYAMYRVYAVVFSGAVELRTPLLVIAAVTMVVAVLSAVGRNDMRSILSFHITSQVGYMIMGLGLFGVFGLAGGIFYILHHIVVKTSLFLVAGSVETLEGSGSLDRLGGVASRRPILAAGFIVSALALAGLPPLSGFFAKLALVRAAFEGADFWIGGVAIAVSFFTLVSMVKIWGGVFWGDAPGADHAHPSRPPLLPRRQRAALVAPAIVLAAIAVAIGLGAEGLYTLSERAAANLVDPSGYADAVLGR